jgi:ABC-type transport system involved in cytochrome c biogenesis permease subunit
LNSLVSRILILVGVLLLVAGFLPPRADSPYDLAAFGRTPVQYGTRVLPLDSVARNTLRLFSDRTSVSVPPGPEFPQGLRLPAIQWLLETIFRPEVADRYPVFSVEHDQLLGLLGQKPRPDHFYSFQDLQPRLDDIAKAAQAADDKKDADAPLDTFDTAVTRLRDNLMLYQRLCISFVPPGGTPAQDWAAWQSALSSGIAAFDAHEANQPYDQTTLDTFLLQAKRYLQLSTAANVGIIPPVAGNLTDPWLNLGQNALASLKSGHLSPVLVDYANLDAALRADDSAGFNAAVATLHHDLGPLAAGSPIRFEAFINRVDPFFWGSLLYCFAFFAACLGWITLGPSFHRGAFWMVVFAFALSVFGMLARVYLTGYGIVTNLYSSALFVGSVAALFGLVIERWKKNGLGVAMASFVGFTTLAIAHSLPFAGDDLEMPRAVLATNFWLWTHVLCIASGYGAMFAAGFLGIGYILAGTFSVRFTAAAARDVARLVYGITCFATFFSFVGTMLGGIWADQSWGRFWGWDPKENGALLIVLWCAICLHARWGRLCSSRTQMALAVFGNIVTTWSWYGTNLLGVGLHSYGFVSGTFYALLAFWATQLFLIALALLPPRLWRSPAAAA